jgi:hypothetical protein
MSRREFGKRRIVGGHWREPGLIEQHLAQPAEKNIGRELRERLLRALKAVGPDDFCDDTPILLQFADIRGAPSMLQLTIDEAPVMLGRADINELIAILESRKDLNEAFGSTKPAHREIGSGKLGEVAAEVTRKLEEGKSVKQIGKELQRQPNDVRGVFRRYPEVVPNTLKDGAVRKLKRHARKRLTRKRLARTRSL